MADSRSIGRYRLQSKIDPGSVTAVYLAVDTMLDREVALKLLDRRFLSDPSFTARFERVAKTVASLEHSAIVPLYDYGEDRGQLYLVMRYMRGGSLVEQIAGGPLTVQQAYDVVRRVGDALDGAHARGVLHRNLKPANILLDEDRKAYVSDFGIAQAAADATDNADSYSIVGTPAYMSPEQAQGDDLDGRSDIYALGVILYEMLTGKRPYGESADNVVALMMAHMQQSIPRVSEANPKLPASLDEIIQKAIAKDRNDRYATGRDMTLALSAVLAGGPADVTLSAKAQGLPVAPPIAHIFLSYSREDSKLKDRLAKDLRKAGLSVWTDDGLEPGTRSWKRAIEREIESAGCFLVLLSPDAKNSEWVERELSYAEICQRQIFPVLARGDKRTAIPISIVNAQYTDLRRDYGRQFETLRDALKRHLERTQD